MSRQIWQDNEGDTMFVEQRPDGTVYGHGSDFDFARPSMDEATAQLKKWGYQYIGEET